MMSTAEREMNGNLYPCLMPLLDALGWQGSQFHILESITTSDRGLCLKDLLNTMANLKFSGRVEENLAMNDIDPRLLPCLFIGADSNALVLVKSDASGSETVLAFDGLTSSYTQLVPDGRKGTAVFFSTPNSEGAELLKSGPDWFYKLMKRFKPVFFHAFLISLILSILSLLSPMFVMTVYDRATSSDSSTGLMFIGIGVIIYLFAESGFKILRQYLLSFLGVRFGNIVGKEILRRILYLPPSYTEAAPLSSQMARIKDFESIREFFGGPAMIAVLDLPFISILFVYLIYIGGTIAYAGLAGILLFIVMGLSFRMIIKKSNIETAASTGQRGDIILEILSNYAAIKYTGLTRRWLDRYRSHSAEAVFGTMQSARLNAVVSALSNAIVALSGIATMAIGVSGVLSGRMTMGALMASMMLIWRILTPLRTGFGVMMQIDRIFRSIAQINRFMAIPIENKPENNMVVNRNIIGRIEMTNVSIRYSKDSEPALLGVGFRVEPGSCMIVTGHGGSGKSTVLKLILGMYTPQAGRILLDDLNILQIDPILLRRSIGYAPQNDHLFYGTLEENLRFSNPSAGAQNIKNAIDSVGLSEEILSMPDGLATLVTNTNPGQFSQSFLKKLSIARLLLKDSAVLMMDEPDKCLSSDDQNRLRDIIAGLKGKKTVLLVTNNSSYFPLADTILWLNHGRVKMYDGSDKVSKNIAGE